LRARILTVAMLATAPAAAVECLDCFGRDLGGHPLRVYLEVGARSVWSRVEDGWENSSWKCVRPVDPTGKTSRYLNAALAIRNRVFKKNVPGCRKTALTEA
jgi:hypothetical protein